MFDSWSLSSSGQLSKNRYNYGHFDQCLDSNFTTDESTYCLMAAKTKEDELDLYHAVCMPRSCGYYTIENIVKDLYKNLGLTSDAQYPRTCSVKKIGYAPIVWRTLWVVGIILATAIGSTLIGMTRYKDRTFLTSFSLARNCETLFNPGKSSRIEVVDGIRVIAMVWIIIYHTFLYGRDKLDQYYVSNMYQIEHQWWYKTMFGGQMAVDTFLTIGGFLIAMKFARMVDHK